MPRLKLPVFWMGFWHDTHCTRQWNAVGVIWPQHLQANMVCPQVSEEYIMTCIGFKSEMSDEVCRIYWDQEREIWLDHIPPGKEHLPLQAWTYILLYTVYKLSLLTTLCLFHMAWMWLGRSSLMDLKSRTVTNLMSLGCENKILILILQKVLMWPLQMNQKTQQMVTRPLCVWRTCTHFGTNEKPKQLLLCLGCSAQAADLTVVASSGNNFVRQNATEDLGSIEIPSPVRSGSPTLILGQAS